ncbi:MAG: hypothetical protein V2I32_12325 [Desulforhopalus sp.]|jgi:hypothetical protein|nr:hypothetical protein [Desulforhopalus sp.]
MENVFAALLAYADPGHENQGLLRGVSLNQAEHLPPPLFTTFFQEADTFIGS